MIVRIELVCDWRRGIVPPVIALRRLLKWLLRGYGVRVLSVHMREGNLNA